MRHGLFCLFLLISSVFVFAAPWDFLRPATEIANVINPIIVWGLGIISLVLFLIAVKALRKKSSKRLMLVTLAFGLFALKSVLNLMDLYFSPGIFMNFAVQGFFDFFILVALFIALFKE